MQTRPAHSPARSLALVVAAALLAACAAEAPLAPRAPTLRHARTEADQLVKTLRAATARYHSLGAAEKDGFVFLHGCEVRPGEGQVGMVYVNFARVLDGVVDPQLPDALIYEPNPSGPPKLVGVEFAVLNTGQPAPTFMGQEFEAEDEFGVYGLHAWVWRDNPEGLFAEAHPLVSCADA